MKNLLGCASLGLLLIACSTTKTTQAPSGVAVSNQVLKIEAPITNASPVAATAQPNTPNSEKCFENLKIIWGVKVTWALEYKKADDAIPTEADLFGPEFQKEMREMVGKEVPKPVCPERGVYTIDRVDQYPSCSVHGRPAQWP